MYKNYSVKSNRVTEGGLCVRYILSGGTSFRTEYFSFIIYLFIWVRNFYVKVYIDEYFLMSMLE